MIRPCYCTRTANHGQLRAWNSVDLVPVNPSLNPKAAIYSLVYIKLEFQAPVKDLVSRISFTVNK